MSKAREIANAMIGCFVVIAMILFITIFTGLAILIWREAL